MTRMTEEQYQAAASRRKTSRTAPGFVLVDGGKGRFRRETAGKARPPRPRHENGSMNAGERAYAMHLDARLTAGEISGWWYELMTFRLADRCSLQPDFTVMLPDGSIEMHEIKGGKWVDQKHGREWTFFAEEDARVKLRMAGSVIPFPIYVIWPNCAQSVKQGGDPWCRQKINGEWWS